MVKTSNSFEFAIVGGGRVGLSCAYKLQVEYPWGSIETKSYCNS